MDDHPLEAGHRLRAAAIREAAPLLGAEGAMYYVVARAADAIVRLHGCRGVDVSADAHARWGIGDGLVFVLGEGDPDHMAPVGQFAAPPDDFWQLPIVRWAFADLGYTAQLNTNVTAGAAHRGLVCFVRRGERGWDPPRKAQRAAHREVVPAFRAAWDLDVASSPPAGPLTIDADGALHGASELVGWARAHDFATWASRAFPKAHVPTPIGQTSLLSCAAAFVARVEDPRGGASYLFDPVRAMDLPPILTALSPTLKRVACLAGAGATNQEIADTLGKSLDTVKEQVADVYRRLGIASRAELAAMTQKVGV